MRGGGPLDRLAVVSDVELEHLAGQGGQRSVSEVRHLDGAAQHQTRERLVPRRADEMKFSHSVQFNAVPDWSSHYISYSNLKKLCVHVWTLL